MTDRLSADEVKRMFPVSHLEQYRNGVCKVIRKSVVPTSVGNDGGGGGQRSNIQYLSSKSRSHLAFVVATTDVVFNSIVTLTYADIFPTSGLNVKMQLNTMLTWLRSAYATFSYVWVLEFQKRGAPHIHIVTNLFEPQTWARKEFAYKWARISSPKQWAEELYPERDWEALQKRVYKVHAHPRTWEAIRDPGGAVKYIIKYCLKTTQKQVPFAFRDVGRFYGWSRDVKDRINCQATIELDDDGLRLILETMGHKTARWDLPPRYIFGLFVDLENQDG